MLACRRRPGGTAVAQDVGELASAARCPSDLQMLLEADTLVYDNDTDTVTAVGGVQIEYGGNRLVAQRVSYNRKTRGAWWPAAMSQIVDSSGTKVCSDEIDITDDFARRVRQRAARRDHRQDLFRGRKRRRRAALSRLSTTVSTLLASHARTSRTGRRSGESRRRKIIWNGKAKTVRFEDSRFEFFGMPIAYFPAFEVPDPTVKRKSGFLFPGVRLQAPTSASA